MDWQGAASGGVGGVVMAALAFFGIKGRLERLERESVNAATCGAVQRDFGNQLAALRLSLEANERASAAWRERVDNKLDTLLRSNGHGMSAD